MKDSWDKRCQWCFSPLGTGDKVGVNNAGIGIFKKHPYIGLAKEVLQNVIDAKDDDVNGPAIAVFELIKVPRNQFPCPDRLSEVIKRCYNYYHDGDDGIKMKRLKDAAERYLDNNEDIPVLKISDYNTVGLTGVKAEKGSNWTGLVREISATNKGNGKSGSFGVGKFAPFNFSSIRTILYSTYNKDGESAIQGKTILTTFKDEDNKLKQNVGLFGLIEDDDCKAIDKKSYVPEVFCRSSSGTRPKLGTDLFVLGFEYEDSKEQEGAETNSEPIWMAQVAISVLEYFFYTISLGKLEVSIKEAEKQIDIKKENLSTLMDKYSEYCQKNEIEFSAPSFWEVLNNTSGKTKYYENNNFENKGKVELYLLVDPDITDKRILEMRAAGMKIKEDTRFKVSANFRGIFIASGRTDSDKPSENINSFLRKCENQAHETWSKDEYEGNTEEADRIIKGIHKWILECIKKEMPEIKASETDAYGLSELIPNLWGDGNEEAKENAFRNFVPVPVSIGSSINKTRKREFTNLDAVKGSNIDQKPENLITPYENGSENNNAGGVTPEENPPHPPYPGPFPGPFPGTDQTLNPQLETKGPMTTQTELSRVGDNGKTKGGAVPHKLKISNIRTPYDSASDSFLFSFVPGETADDVFLKLRIGTDDENKSEADVLSALLQETPLKLDSGYILIPHVDKGAKTIITVKLRNAKRCPLEVVAYVK